MYNYNWEDSLDRESVNQYLTPREVMDLLYIGKNTLYQLLNSGQLKGFRIGKLWRIRREALRDFVERANQS
ncbi:MAG: helix-turn-helix domain-containing protein [Oscillospiraceae bacterium]|jgi:excisionase family DNA binding protein|nr:helix-turn-helix domain-containing protein [Oscillospiraceae bacterium]